MIPTMASYHPSPSKPRLRLPAGACDAHFHVFGPRERFAFAAGRSYTPASDAPKETLFALHAHLGIQRGVVVQSAVHGFDNSAAADLIAHGKGNYVGVALVRTDIPDAELEALDRQGFCGARFHYMDHLGAAAPIADVLALAKRLAPLRWHLQIHVDARRLEELAPALKRSPVPVVIDHMARIDASLGLDQTPFRKLLELLEDEKFWVKVSGSERASRERAPWRDALPFARKLVAEHGSRALWGTDWPHPNLNEVPDDGLMVDLLAEIAPAEAERRALLVDNPQRLYRFRGGVL
jgi:2-pyrone-4,6-dicarboxylate lactonase